MSKVTFVETADRKKGVEASLNALDTGSVKNADVLVKPNFNTADAAPGSTHNDTLVALIDHLWKLGAKTISLGERSYPETRQVMEQKGVLPLLEERDVRVIDFDDLNESDWVEFKPADSHWINGFRIARPILEAECLVSTCCLKTHQFGGAFTMSLKLHVGVVPTFRHGFPYMSELHQSLSQQEMIAEINAPFSPDIVLLDGVEAFVDGGPATGKRAFGNVILASGDRVAIDAVGVAVLKHLGSNPAIMEPKIFDQRQIRRAAELNIGASAPADIELAAADEKSSAYMQKIRKILLAG